MSKGEDYFGMDRAFQEPVKKVPQVVTLSDKHREITALNREISLIVSGVKDNPKLQAFSETIRTAGVFGMMGLVQEIPELLPELAPLAVAFQKMVEVGEKQHALTGEIIEVMEGVLNVR